MLSVSQHELLTRHTGDAVFEPGDTVVTSHTDVLLLIQIMQPHISSHVACQSQQLWIMLKQHLVQLGCRVTCDPVMIRCVPPMCVVQCVCVHVCIFISTPGGIRVCEMHEILQKKFFSDPGVVMHEPDSGNAVFAAKKIGAWDLVFAGWFSHGMFFARPGGWVPVVCLRPQVCLRPEASLRQPVVQIKQSCQQTGVVMSAS